MNYYTLIAGAIATFALIGHLTMGCKLYLNPMKNADFDVVPKKVMQTLFHYITVFQLLSAFFLVMTGIRGEGCQFDTFLIHGFILVNYTGFGIVQIIYALNSGIKGGLFKMFQWVFWLLIALFTAAGMCPFINA